MEVQHNGAPRIIGCAHGGVAVKLFRPMDEAVDPLAALRREFAMGLELNELRLQHVVRIHGYCNAQQQAQQKAAEGQQEAAGAGAPQAAPPQGAALPEGARHALVMEYCALGSLADVIKRIANRWGATLPPR